jgi:paraquat-inducible protein B
MAKRPISPTLLGAFIIGAIALMIAAALSFGSAKFFGKTERFIVQFDESVHGLDVGAPVKLRGVRAGRVVAVHVSYDPATGRTLVPVVCEVDRQVLTDRLGRAVSFTDQNTISMLVRQGLQARLALVGITGLLYVEMDFKQGTGGEVGQANFARESLPVVPSAQSSLAEISSTLLGVVNQLAEVDFAGISRDVRTLLTNANQTLAELELKTLVASLTEASQAIRDLAQGRDEQQLLANMNAAVTDVRNLVTTLESEFGALGSGMQVTIEEANQAMQNFRETAVVVREFFGPQRGITDEVSQTLESLGRAAIAVERLADYLERNPNALLLGRRPDAR